eukprot:8078743-Prorocentrum_lima.AAC.1
MVHCSPRPRLRELEPHPDDDVPSDEELHVDATELAEAIRTHVPGEEKHTQQHQSTTEAFALSRRAWANPAAALLARGPTPEAMKRV